MEVNKLSTKSMAHYLLYVLRGVVFPYKSLHIHLKSFPQPNHMISFKVCKYFLTM